MIKEDVMDTRQATPEDLNALGLTMNGTVLQGTKLEAQQVYFSPERKIVIHTINGQHLQTEATQIQITGDMFLSVYDL